jgi:hypothetical protein
MNREEGSGQGLSKLGLLILRSIPKGKGLEEIAELADVPPVTLGKEIAILQMKGYIGEDGRLTQKGREASQP